MASWIAGRSESRWRILACRFGRYKWISVFLVVEERLRSVAVDEVTFIHWMKQAPDFVFNFKQLFAVIGVDYLLEPVLMLV